MNLDDLKKGTNFSIGKSLDSKSIVNENSENFYGLDFKENSLEFLGTLEFDEIWLKSSLLHLIARKDIFLVKEEHKFEFQLKKEFGLILL
jgi:hypothetical protein